MHVMSWTSDHANVVYLTTVTGACAISLPIYTFMYPSASGFQIISHVSGLVNLV